MPGIGRRFEFLGQLGSDAFRFHESLDAFVIDSFAATLDFLRHFTATAGSALLFMDGFDFFG